MNKCTKTVGGKFCSGTIIKHGCIKGRQRFRCKSCSGTCMEVYINKACHSSISRSIVDHVNEGCGIRSIARLLNVSVDTVLSRIKRIANHIKKPTIQTGSVYEVDELKTYIKSKACDYWVIYALDRQSGQVVDLKVGKRTKANLQRVTDTLLLAKCKQIYTDGLGIYKQLIPAAIHTVRRYWH